MQDQTHVERLSRLLRMLTANSSYRKKHLAQALGVSERTIYRYIDALRTGGFVVEAKDNGLLQISDYRSSLLKVSASDCADQMENLTLAMRQERCVMFRDDKEKIRCLRLEDYVFEPYAFSSDGQRVITYCHNTDYIDVVDLSRIGSVRILEQAWEHKNSHRPVYFDLWGGWGEYAVELKIWLSDTAASDLVSMNPMAKEYLRSMPSNCYLFDGYCCDTHPVLEFLLEEISQFNLCCIISPPSLIKSFDETIEVFRNSRDILCMGEGFFDDLIAKADANR